MESDDLIRIFVTPDEMLLVAHHLVILRSHGFAQDHDPDLPVLRGYRVIPGWY